MNPQRTVIEKSASKTTGLVNPRQLRNALLVAGVLAAATFSPVAAKPLASGFICADDGNKRIAVFDEAGTCLWEYPAPKPYEAHLSPDGNVLLATGHGVQLVSPSKEIVWEYKTKSEVYGADLLPGGGVLVGECTSGLVLQLDSKGNVVNSFKTTYEKGGHMTMRNIRLTPQQTVLVGHLGDNCVREYTLEGKLVAEFQVPSKAYMGIRLDNGNTLVAHQTGVVEFDANKNTIWELKDTDVPKMGCKWINVIQPLANGNLVVGNWLGHGHNGEGVPLFEVDHRRKKVVRKFTDAAAVKQVTAFKPLDDRQLQRFQTGSGGAGTAALRAAIEDLMATFGRDYPRGKEFLARLDAGEPPDSLRREALAANPLVSGQPILFVVRKQYKSDHHNTATLFQSGEINAKKYDPPGVLKMLDISKGWKVSTLLDPGATGLARDPEVSFDGKRVVFSMRKSSDADYHIHEINVDGSGLRQLTSAPGVSDIDPLYLPNGDIVFSATREPKFCMCNRHIMANLFRMESDGANIHQIGKSTLFEGHSSLMPDGRILYDRWEYVDRNFGDAQGLWTVNPDGTSHAIYWGNNTASPGGVIDARIIPGTQLCLCIFGSCHDRPWGALAIIDRSKGVDGAAPVVRTWPASAKQLVKAEIDRGYGFDLFKKVSPRYEDPYPLSEKYFLASRTTGNGEEMGIYLIDTFGNEVFLHSEAPGCFDPMPIAQRPAPVMKPSTRNFASATGTFYVQDVYIGTHMEGVERGSIKYLRIVESPEKRNWVPQRWGGQGTQAPGMNWTSFENKRILGTVPVEEDGSAFFEVPADRFVFFQALDENGMLVQSMRSGTIIQPGETQGCVGCHENRVEDAPYMANQPMALKRAPSKLNGWYGEPRTFSYMKEVQPIFDKHCLDCHDYGKKGAGKLLLSGDRTIAFNASYIDLQQQGAIQCIGAGPADIQPAYSWGSHPSKLIQVLREGHENVKLSKEEMVRLITWLDINAPYYPVYECAYPNNPCGRSPITVAQMKRLEELTGVQCIASHRQPGRAQVSFDRPEKSPCLANLEKGSAEYKEVLAIIQAGRMQLEKRPRADMDGFVPNATDLKRMAKYEERRNIELANRAAIRGGRKRYDHDGGLH